MAATCELTWNSDPKREPVASKSLGKHAPVAASWCRLLQLTQTRRDRPCHRGISLLVDRAGVDKGFAAHRRAIGCQIAWRKMPSRSPTPTPCHATTLRRRRAIATAALLGCQPVVGVDPRFNTSRMAGRIVPLSEDATLVARAASVPSNQEGASSAMATEGDCCPSRVVV